MKVLEIKNCQSCPNHSFKAYPWLNGVQPKMVCNFEKDFLKQKLIPVNCIENNTIPDFCKLEEVKEKTYTIEEIKAYCTSWLKPALCTDMKDSVPENNRLQAVIHYIDMENDSDSIENFLEDR